MRVGKLGAIVTLAFALLGGSVAPVQADCSLNECYDQYWNLVPCDGCQYNLVACYGWDDFGNYTQCACPTCGPPPGPTNDSQFNAQVVPNQVATGEVFQVTVDFTNTGTSTWPANGAYRLGSQSPQDNFTWGLNRVELTADIQPGESFAFTFRVTAPVNAGNYSFQWKMVQEGVQWFGATSNYTIINVRSETPPPVNTRSDQYICPGYPDTCVGMCGGGCDGIWFNGQIVKKWTCECMKDDLQPRWCPFYRSGGGPGCVIPFTAAEDSFLFQPDLTENGLWSCDLSQSESPQFFCSGVGSFDTINVPPGLQPGPGERLVGSKSLVVDWNPRRHPYYGYYDSARDAFFMTFATTGRARLGISCKATLYTIFRVGQDSALCLYRGICSSHDRQVEQSDITWLKNSFGVGSRELPFYHECTAHGFGWYNALNIEPGMYVAAAGTGSFFFGIFDGHGTGDTFWYERTGTCTPSCSGKTCGASDGCGGTCCSGSGCTPVSCPTCQQPNACGSACEYSPAGTWCPGGTCNGSGTCEGGGGGGGCDGGYCGGQSPEGCWCDYACPSHGDCCFNACSLCGYC